MKARAVVSSKALGMLKVTADAMKDFFDRCIECGTASEISAVNVHAANGIAAIFLACGQDAADIVMSGICATSTEIIDGKDLLIETRIPNLLVGTVGGGTGLGTQSECLNIMGCLGTGQSNKFAEIIAATVLAGEFPTAAAVISRTYVDIHNKYGRNKDKLVRD
jgi:hydroxymethylglutaryl-CoA reductase (NADPH)